jgi:hypothetical protein
MTSLASTLPPFDLAQLARDITLAVIARYDLSENVSLDDVGTAVGKMYVNCLAEIASAPIPGGDVPRGRRRPKKSHT